MYGTLPWHPDVWLDSEDALDLQGRGSRRGSPEVAVVRLPRISNFTDVDALGLEPDLDVVFAAHPALWPMPTWWCCPAPAPPADLAWLRGRGLDRAVLAHAAPDARARHLRRLPDAGTEIRDPDGVEGRRSVPGWDCSTCAPISPRRFSAHRTQPLPIHHRRVAASW